MVSNTEEKLVCVGVIASAHGVRGELNIVPHLENPDFLSTHSIYTDKAGNKSYSLRIKGKKQRFLIAAIEGVTDRNMAEALKGVELYVPRSLFPAPEEEEFYYDDLAGLLVHTPSQKNYGTVVAVYNFGAGDVIEIRVAATEKLVMYPFSREVVPEIDLEEGYVVVVPPETVNAKEEPPSGKK